MLVCVSEFFVILLQLVFMIFCLFAWSRVVFLRGLGLCLCVESDCVFAWSRIVYLREVDRRNIRRNIRRRIFSRSLLSRIFSQYSINNSTFSKTDVLHDLRQNCESVMMHLFGIDSRDDLRWSSDYFPFTDPSLELEIRSSASSKVAAASTTASFKRSDEDLHSLEGVGKNDKWIEVLGSGVLQDAVLRAGGVDPGRVHGWAFGFGLERLAMLLFGIPDIRLFWSEDRRFHEQFEGLSDDLERGGEKWRDVRFEPFSRYPPIAKDISFWIPGDFEENDFFEILREDFGEELRAKAEKLEKFIDHRSTSCNNVVTSDEPLLGENLVESVRLIDDYTHPKTFRKSRTYRIVYRDMSRTLTHDQINRVQERVVVEVQKKLGVVMR